MKCDWKEVNKSNYYYEVETGKILSTVTQSIEGVWYVSTTRTAGNIKYISLETAKAAAEDICARVYFTVEGL